MGGAAAGDRDAWRRGLAGWHIVFGVLAALTAVLIIGDNESSAVERWSALGALAALCGWYATVGVRALRGESAGLGIGYLAVAAPLTVTVFALAGIGVLTPPDLRAASLPEAPRPAGSPCRPGDRRGHLAGRRRKPARGAGQP